MAKATDIRWETDGYNVDLPTEMEIPSRFIDDDGIDEDAVSDWLSNTTGYLHSGFSIVDDWRTELFIASETDYGFTRIERKWPRLGSYRPSDSDRCINSL